MAGWVDRTWWASLEVGVLGVATLAVYLATVAPGLSWANGGGDGAELATAAYGWGVAHPPGYPLYLTALRLAQTLPVGDIALRSNLFSALAASGAAVLLTLTVRRLLERDGGGGLDVGARVGAVFAGAAFAFGPRFWSQALVTEVYTFQALLLSLFLLRLAACRGRPTPGRVLALAASLGLLVSHHTLFGIVAVPLVLRARGMGLPSRTWLGAGGVLVGLPLLLLLSLWLRAALQPWLSWGDAVTPGAWWVQVSAASYHDYFLSASAQEHAQRTAFAAATLARQGGWLAAALAALGAVWLWHQRRSVAWVAGVVGAGCGVFAVLYNARDSIVYLLPTVQLLALAAGVGAAWVWRVASTRGAAGLAVALAVSVGWQVWAGWPEVSVAADTSARAWGTLVLASAPAGGVVWVTQEERLFVLWYLQGVERVRPDVVVLDPGLVSVAWFRTQLARQHPALTAEELERLTRGAR